MDVSPMSSAVFLSMLFILVGLPALSWATTIIVTRWLRHKERMAQVPGDETAQHTARNGTKVERLEQRMGVIERILTDRSTNMSDEIERLRDAPIN